MARSVGAALIVVTIMLLGTLFTGSPTWWQLPFWSVSGLYWVSVCLRMMIWRITADSKDCTFAACGVLPTSVDGCHRRCLHPRR